MFYNNEEAGRAVGHCFPKMLNCLHDSSIGGKLPSYTIYSCICIDTHNVQGVGLVHRACVYGHTVSTC